MSRTRILLPAALLILIGACAQSNQPPGGPVPETPPQVIAVSPDTFEIREPFDGSLRVEFNRRMSERPSSGTLRDAVVVSPRTGDVEVSHHRNGIEISMEGGFLTETVYQVTILPQLQDLFQNRMAAPFDFFFSTGPDFEQNLLAGVLVDRLTLQDLAGGRVDARRMPDGPTHSTVADSTGIFAFQYLPSGRYRVTAYEDLNRNRESDFDEPKDAVEIGLEPGDTLILAELSLLESDTTAAVAAGATVLDSLSVEVRFDDYFDPDQALEGATAMLTREERDAPEVVEVLHRWEWDAREALRSEAEADDPDTVDPDSAAVDPDSVAVDPEQIAFPAAAQEPGADFDDDPVLPAQEFVLILDTPLEPGAVYTVQLAGFTNINGITGGGGEVELEVPEPEPEEDPGDDPPDGTDGGPPDGVPPGPSDGLVPPPFDGVDDRRPQRPSPP